MQVFFANRAWLAYAGTTVIQIVPQSIGPVAHEWLNSYNATTGLFTESQPSFADISGNLAEAQLPAAGVTHTVTLAALTALERREASLSQTESRQISSIRRKLYWRCNRGWTCRFGF